MENRASGAFREAIAAVPDRCKHGNVGRYNGAVAFVIRDFKPEDFETALAHGPGMFPPGIAYSKPELKGYMRHRGSFTLVAADAEKGKIAGFHRSARGGATGHVITIDVIRRRAALGGGIVAAAGGGRASRAAGSHAVGLETAVDNIAALAFYKRHGYSVIRTWPRYYSNGVDALVMRKELAEMRRSLRGFLYPDNLP